MTYELKHDYDSAEGLSVKEREAEINAYLAAEGVEFEVRYKGSEVEPSTVKGMKDQEWDVWGYSFARKKNGKVVGGFSGTYKTGIGLRRDSLPSLPYTEDLRKKDEARKDRAARFVNRLGRPGQKGEGAIVEKPTALDVLYCLAMESYASDMAFDDWCSEYGYDTDSRKALETYLACQESDINLRRVSLNIETLRVLTHGY